MATLQKRRPLDSQQFAPGKDSLTRMLQLEKKNKERRLSDNTSNLSSPKVSSLLDGPNDRNNPRTSLTTQTAPTPPSHVPRSQTAPVLPTQASFSDKTTIEEPRLQMDLMERRDSSAHSAICKSPSWSDFGGSKQKKEQKRLDKEKKETWRRLRKEEKEEDRQRAAAAKASKRQDRRPPAAMDTQRLPAALRRSLTPSPINSRSSSVDSTTSRHSSKSERRSSITSLASMMGWTKSPSIKSNASTTSNETLNQNTISSKAPQLPKLTGLGNHSRKTSPSPRVSRFSEGQEVYEKDVLSFAYHLDTSINTTTSYHQNTKPVKAVRISMPGQSPDTPPPSRGSTDSDHAGSRNPPPPRSPLRPILVKRVSSETSQSLSVQDGAISANRGRDSSESPTANLEAQQGEPPDLANDLSKLSTKNKEKHPKAIFSNVLNTQAKLSYQCTSYVHKQRMHAQQRSLAEYEDEMAVKAANERINSRTSLEFLPQSLPPTPKDSGESLQTGREDLSVPKLKQDAEKAKTRMPGEHEPDLYHDYVSEKPKTTDGKRESRIPKAEKILGSSPETKHEPSLTPSAPVKKGTFSHDIGSTTTTASSTSPLIKEPTSRASNVAEAQEEPNGKTKTNRFSRALETVSSRRNSLLRPINTKPAQQDQTTPVSKLSPAQLNPYQPLKSLPKSSTASNLPPLKGQAMQPSTSAKVTTEVEVNSQSSLRPAETETMEKNIGVPPPGSPKKPTLEVIVESVDGDGVVRQRSLKRSQSNPQLDSKVPAFDFLPELKHQPLTKPRRSSPKTSPTRAKITDAAAIGAPPSSSDFPVLSSEASSSSSASSSALQVLPKAPFTLPSYSGPMSPRQPSITPTLHNSNPSAKWLGPSNLAPAGKGKVISTGKSDLAMKPIAKVFVICCKCKHWHDLPSSVYEAMALPGKVEAKKEPTTVLTPSPEQAAKENAAKKAAEEKEKKEMAEREKVVESRMGKGMGNVKGGDKGTNGKAKLAAMLEGKVFTTVKCPWCEHGMSTGCCAGWTTVVYLHERHH